MQTLVDDGSKQKHNYCTNCKVGGHGQRFCEYFLERSSWKVYPNQKWFEDEKGNEYHCPLGDVGVHTNASNSDFAFAHVAR